MYLEYFGLRMFPFANTADPRFFYANEAHEEALANMTYAIEQGKGMVVITGEIGAGKTLSSNVLSLRLRRNTVIVTISDPLVRGDQLMRCVYVALMGQHARKVDRISMQEAIVDRLIALQRMGQKVAVIVDESQDLTKSALEQLRLMSNWENRSEKLIQWIIIGQSELIETLKQPQWEHLRQRVVLKYHLGKLQGENVGDYITHRLKVAAGGREADVCFDAEAVAMITKISGCTPRLINNICDAALLAAFAEGKRTVDASIVEAVSGEMTSCAWLDEPTDPLAEADLEQDTTPVG